MLPSSFKNGRRLKEGGYEHSVLPASLGIASGAAFYLLPLSLDVEGGIRDFMAAALVLYSGAVAGGATQHFMNRKQAVGAEVMPPPKHRLLSLSVNVHPRGVMLGGVF